MTEAEATMLIEALKQLYDELFYLPEPGVKLQLEATEINKKNSKFKIEIFVRRRDPKTASFSAFALNPQRQLMRLDIVNEKEPHQNPGGKIIYGPHFHIYKDGTELKEAIPFDPQNKDLVAHCLDFLKKFHVLNADKITIRQNQTLF